MRVPVHLRIARSNRFRDRFKVAASVKPNPAPLDDPDGRALHTVHVALSLNVPDEVMSPQGAIKVEVDVPPTDPGVITAQSENVPVEPVYTRADLIRLGNTVAAAFEEGDNTDAAFEDALAELEREARERPVESKPQAGG